MHHGLVRYIAGLRQVKINFKRLIVFVIIVLGILFGPPDSIVQCNIPDRPAVRENPVDLNVIRMEVASAGAEQHANHLDRRGVFTAYTSRPQETRGNAFITADGTDLRKVDYCVVAHNHLKFDTVIEIERVGKCRVKDRMGRGGRNKFDIYFGKQLKLARQFGVKRLKYKVVK